MSSRWDLKAAEFDRTNPQVMGRLEELAIRAINHGRKRLSINELFEVLRYEHGIQSNGESFLLNNNFRAWYARQLMARNARLAGMFATRGDNDQEPRDVSPGAMLAVAVDGLTGTSYDDEDGEDWS